VEQARRSGRTVGAVPVPPVPEGLFIERELGWAGIEAPTRGDDGDDHALSTAGLPAARR